MSPAKTREYLFGAQIIPGAPLAAHLRTIRGSGWAFAAEKCPDVYRLRHKDRLRQRMPAEWMPYDVLVRARNREQAQSVATLFHAANAVANGSLPMTWFLGWEALAAPVAVPRDFRDLEGLDEDVARNAIANVFMSDGVPTALTLTARASRKRSWQYAIYKLLDSYVHVNIDRTRLDPNEYSYDPLKASPWPRDHVRFSAAITSAYAAIEELDLTVRAIAVSHNNIRAKYEDGSWVPAVLADIRSRLKRANVHELLGTYWHLRGPQRRHEKAKSVNTHGRTPWTRGAVRDAYVGIADALDHARWLRNKVTGHRIDARTRSLTPYDVANVQGLARTLIMSATGSWWDGYDPLLLPSKDQPEDAPN